MMTQTFDPKIPILMYHEVSTEPLDRNQSYTQSYTMTPLYDLPAGLFEAQLKALSERRYTSLLFEDLPRLQADQKYVILTFDDGLKGNYRHALPILKKYGFKAVFFINVGAIGSERFMNWEELRELVKQGMSVQSHGLSHKPLQTLNDKEINEELFMSKQILEEKLQTSVSALSFPHGSYNKKIVLLAKQIGYKYLCTSDVDFVYLSSFQKDQKVLGRIAVTNKLSNQRFMNIVEYNRTELAKQKFKKLTKDTLKKIIGIENYRYFYRKYFNIKK